MTNASGPSPARGQLPAAFDGIAALLKARTGLVIGPEKLYLLETRMAPVMRRAGLRDLAALADRLRDPGAGALMAEVVEVMTTHESFFFRDGKPFEHFGGTVLPRLIAGRPAGQPIRIWSAAASSGQEAYSLAMILAENRAQLGGRPVQVLGTDIARDTLARARAGEYSQFEVQRGLPVAMLHLYFARSGESWRISDRLRGMVEFREWNLLDDPAPLGRFDVIFCRNVLIYFDQPTKTRVLNHIARQLAPDGALYLGGAETVLGLTDRLTAVPGERGVYMPAGGAVAGDAATFAARGPARIQPAAAPVTAGRAESLSFAR